MLTYKSTLVKTKLYCIVHQQSCPLLYVLSLPLVHPNSVVPTTVLSASASQWLARSQSCNWIHRPQIRIISSWSWKPKRHEVENHELKHEHSHLQYCICNSSFNNTICYFYNAQSSRICPHQITENMWAKEVADHLHSVALSCTAWIWHRYLLVFYIEKLIMELATSWRHDCLQGPPTLGAVVCTYNTPLGFEGRNVVINGSLLCSSGQHSHNMCQGYLELDTSCFRP